MVDSILAAKLSAKHMEDIRRLFAKLLAARLGRSEEEIIGGLGAGDFRSDQEVRIEHPDGSVLRFRNAFALRDPESGDVGIFSEHMGYYLFRDPGGDLEVVASDTTL